MEKEHVAKLERILRRKILYGEVIQAERMMTGVSSLLDLCGDDYKRDGVQDTPLRVVSSFLELTEGFREDPKLHLYKTFDVQHQELVLVKDIEFQSMCEHHLLPFFGVAHVAYIPNKKITGLSKIARMVDGYAKRFQVQERLTGQIADALMDVLEAQGAMVVLDAKHMCMCGRGVKKSSASTVTSSVRGVFATEPEARAEFLSLIRK